MIVIVMIVESMIVQEGFPTLRTLKETVFFDEVTANVITCRHCRLKEFITVFESAKVRKILGTADSLPLMTL